VIESYQQGGNMKRKLIIFLALVAVVCFAVPALADTSFDFQIGIPNSDLFPYPSPFLDVKITLGTGANAGKALFDVKSLTSGNYLYLFGGNDALGLNFDIPSGDTITLSNFVGTPWKNTPTISQAGSHNYSEFGVMNTTVSLSGGYTTALKELTFAATLKSGVTQVDFTDAAAVLMNNSKDYFAAAHIFIQDTTNTVDAVKTGFAGNGVAVVPLPGAMLLLGAGVARLVAYARRRQDS
jgi:hypothetical protein